MDSLVQREEVDGWTNLAIGDAVVVREAYKHSIPTSLSLSASELGYPPCDGLPELQAAILKWCISEGVCTEDHPGHVVITNGATQGLLAVISAYEGIKLSPPYWPRIPVLADFAGVTLNNEKQGSACPELITWPNNPSGCEFGTNVADADSGVIWDAVYASEIYGFDPALVPFLQRSDAIIGSVSKIFGLSGLRVGWVLFKDRAHWEKASHYLETSTSGVSVISQLYTADLLDRVNKFPAIFQKIKKLAKKSLETNSRIIQDVVTPFASAVGGSIGGHGGLFAWFRPSNYASFKDALNRAKIFIVRGDLCGFTKEWIRINAGADAVKIQDSMGRLAKELG